MPSLDSRKSPSIDVIIATRDRHELLLGALESILGQDYAGNIRVTVVYDHSPVRHDIIRTEDGRAVRTTANTRSKGLAGARNTGILMADADLVAFCDDDDMWRPRKIMDQVTAMSARGTFGCVSGIEVHYGEKRRMRVPDISTITVAALSRSRLTGAHPSTYVFDRSTLVDHVGLVDEHLPYGYGEDLDLLLRAAAHGPIAVVQTATTDVLWHEGSYFSQRWAAMAAGLGYLLEKHPSIGTSRKGAAWLEGQRAFALAASGVERKEAFATATRSLRSSILEPRGYLALGVLAGVIKPDALMRILNARGRGI